MRNMRISLKLLVGFTVVVAFAIAVGVVGIYGMGAINAADDALYNENLLSISALGDIRENFQEQRVLINEFVNDAENESMLQEYRWEIAALESRMDALFLRYEAAMSGASDEHAFFDAKYIYLTEFDDVKQTVFQASMHSFEEAHAALDDPSNAAIVDAITDGFDLSMRQNEGWAKESVDKNSTLFRQMRAIQIGVIALAVAVSMFLALYISGLINKPLALLTRFMKKASSTGDITLSREDVAVIGKMSNVKDEIGQCITSTAAFVGRITEISNEMESISGGDLTSDVKLLSESDVMGASMKNMIDNLNNMFAEINSSSSQVSAGSKQIADGAQSLAQGSTEQAASVEQLSSSIADIAQKTKSNAEIAGKAAELAHTIMASAEKGSSQMDEMIQAVKEINEASQSIGKIIKTIDDIAFQTNILALNAAVEAARAGQHGKGFAVVAEEVRNLAAKSAEAAKDTGSMIQNSMEKAEFGSRIAGDTATSLTEIVSGISESNRLIDEIAISSEEQSQGIGQVNIGIDQVAQVVAQNSATAEESAAASEQLSGQSDILQSLIAQFKLKSQSAGQLMIGVPGAPRPDTAHAPLSEYAPPAIGSADFGKY